MGEALGGTPLRFNFAQSVRSSLWIPLCFIGDDRTTGSVSTRSVPKKKNGLPPGSRKNALVRPSLKMLMKRYEIMLIHASTQPYKRIHRLSRLYKYLFRIHLSMSKKVFMFVISECNCVCVWRRINNRMSTL